MNSSVVRLIVGIGLGLVAAGSSLFFFLNQSILGSLFNIAIVPLMFIIVFIASSIINMTISSINCGIDLKKSTISATAPATVAGIITLSYLLVEPFFSVFSFPFNTIAMTQTMRSVAGLAFVLFWFGLYSQVVAAGYSEACN
jgi:hypothetical protein